VQKNAPAQRDRQCGLSPIGIPLSLRAWVAAKRTMNSLERLP